MSHMVSASFLFFFPEVSGACMLHHRFLSALWVHTMGFGASNCPYQLRNRPSDTTHLDAIHRRIASIDIMSSNINEPC